MGEVTEMELHVEDTEDSQVHQLFGLVYPIGHYFTFYMVVGIFKVKDHEGRRKVAFVILFFIIEKPEQFLAF
ncbi:hypothetical protein [Paenibacillus larvae]|uniref:hypothetical protein n=1 Tax=Paenibacillus larvae TaxID=1464 RepID=UPI00288EBC29|nr:hypothetical protein [Paenibacillus larvae]MDT2191063.1 hypothetical protein [Paenibacillus larvae]